MTSEEYRCGNMEVLELVAKVILGIILLMAFAEGWRRMR